MSEHDTASGQCLTDRAIPFRTGLDHDVGLRHTSGNGDTLYAPLIYREDKNIPKLGFRFQVRSTSASGSTIGMLIAMQEIEIGVSNSQTRG